MGPMFYRGNEMTFATYPLDHPRVQQARLRFYECRHRYSGRRKGPTFEKLYELACQPFLTVTQIARQLGSCLATLKNLFNRHIAPLIGETARQRYRRILKHAREQKERQASKILPQTLWADVVKNSAEKAGRTVFSVVGRHADGGLHTYRDRVAISGYRCYVHPIRKATIRSSTHKQRHAAPSVSRAMLEEFDFQLFPVLIQGLPSDTYVIPSSLILEKYFQNPERQTAVLYIPFRRRLDARHDAKKRICFEHFRNRWNQIPLAAAA